MKPYRGHHFLHVHLEDKRGQSSRGVHILLIYCIANHQAMRQSISLHMLGSLTKKRGLFLLPINFSLSPPNTAPEGCVVGHNQAEDIWIVLPRLRTHPAILRVVRKPAHNRFQHVLLVAHVELLHGQQLAEPVGGHLAELLRERHVAQVRLQVLGGHVVHVVQAVVQREEADADAVLGRDAALQELTAEELEVGEEEQVRGLHHVLDGVLAQTDLRMWTRYVVSGCGPKIYLNKQNITVTHWASSAPHPWTSAVNRDESRRCPVLTSPLNI